MDTEAASPAPLSSFDPMQNWHPSGDEAGRLTIDLDAIAFNWRRLAQLYPSRQIGAVVKADAYGLGARMIAPALAGQGARIFFVAHLSEALDLKPVLPEEASIYVLNGLAPGLERACADAGIVPVLNTAEQARAWCGLGAELVRPLPAALQMDTGMSRLGLSDDELDELLGWPAFNRFVDICLLMTHLACADTPDSATNADQLLHFEKSSSRIQSVPRSIANSAATLYMPGTAGDVLRPGLVLYGVEPGAGGAPGMRAAVRLDARIIQIRHIQKGTGVGYGLDYVADRNRRIATLSAGYADGWPRALSSRGAAWFEGHRLPVLGRISMDSCVVDLTDLPEGHVRPGDLVELIGPHQSVSDLAAEIGTTPHEILTGLGRRFARTYLSSAPSRSEESVT